MARPIDCVLTNVQPGFQRFSSDHAPEVKYWRCELTGLSHSYNLYFVACNDEIHVYTPQFPTQHLSAISDVILYPPVSSPGLSPGIDLDDPHSITRLHVAYLGREEVLLVTCDDGDVVGYRVPEIHRVISECDRSSGIKDAVDLGRRIRVFLHRNVGASAWGLAVHREARMIAISANTHQVTVLAYALTDAAGDSDWGISAGPEDLYPDGPYTNEKLNGFPRLRWRDCCITLQASTNIPAVHFDQGDTSGRWLICSTINGDNHVWDLHNTEMPAKSIELGYCVSATDPAETPEGPCRCPNRTSVPHASWGAMFVEPRSCHPTTSLADAFGPGHSSNPCHPMFWDITDTKSGYSLKRGGPFPGSYNQADPFSDGSDDMSLSGSDGSGEILLAISDQSDAMSLAASDTSLAATSINGEDIGEAESEGEDSDQMSSADGHQSETQEMNIDHDTPSNEAPATESTNNNHLLLEQPAQAPVISQVSSPSNSSSNVDSEESDDEFPMTSAVTIAGVGLHMAGNDETFAAMSAHATAVQALLNSGPLSPTTNTITEIQLQILQQRHAIASKYGYCYTHSSDAFRHLQPRPSKPCIIVTKEEVYLYQRPFDDAPFHNPAHPVMVMRNPLFPPMNSLRAPPPYHRNCYTAQIPELGIFIVASPAARVGIFQLTSYTDARYTDPIYGFRLHSLLPSTRDGNGEVVIEEVGRRLIGVAVGPVQGMLDREGEEDGGGDGDGNESVGNSGGGVRGAGMGPRRWRLMLHFHDHTVYSYELGKFGGSEAPGLGDLVV